MLRTCILINNFNITLKALLTRDKANFCTKFSIVKILNKPWLLSFDTIIYVLLVR